MSLVRRHGPMTVIAALFALLLRVLVPQGMMLTPTAGGIVMTVCSGDAAMSGQVVIIDGKTKPAHDRGDIPCAFAVAAAPALADIAVPIPLPPLAVAAPAVVAMAGIVAIGRGLAAPPPPATGPPATV